MHLHEKEAASECAIDGEIPSEITHILGSVPSRWGRMAPLCRLVVIEAGRMLKSNEIVNGDEKCSTLVLNVGLVGATRYGSLHTDLAFMESARQGAGLASPALFGYTLPNIGLAEAATHYGLMGPVYALFDTDSPLEVAVEEAEMLLAYQTELSMMLACYFDHYRVNATQEKLVAQFKLIKRNAKN